MPEAGRFNAAFSAPRRTLYASMATPYTVAATSGASSYAPVCAMMATCSAVSGRSSNSSTHSMPFATNASASSVASHAPASSTTALGPVSVGVTDAPPLLRMRCSPTPRQ